MARVSVVWRYLITVVAVALTTAFYRHLFHVNPTTVALTFLLITLLVSAYWGFQVAAVTAVLATACFNFFFLPPVGTFTIADPQNWIALFVFLVTAIVASNLAERARREAEQATRRRTEVERLYSLSQALLTAEGTVELLNKVPAMVADAFALEGAMLRVTDRDTTYKSKPDVKLDSGKLRTAIIRGEPFVETESAYVPLRIGLRTTGALGIAGEPLSKATLDAIGGLVGIAIERAAAVEEVTKTRAQQENERLRSALLDSVTHEFRTPLTGIKASVTSLLDGYQLDEGQRHELLTVIDEETDRLNRLVGEAAEMSQLDSGMFTLDKTPSQIGEVINRAMEQAGSDLESRDLVVEVPSGLPPVTMDAKRIQEVLLHLIQNAAKYAREGEIRISAQVQDRFVVCSVADQGPGIDTLEQSLIFDKFYRGRYQRYAAQGTGMGLAICKTIVEAHGGTIGVVSQLGNGSVFWFRLPFNPR